MRKFVVRWGGRFATCYSNSVDRTNYIFHIVYNLGAVQRKKSEIIMEVGGWVHVPLQFFCGKSSPSSSTPVLIFWSSVP